MKPKTDLRRVLLAALIICAGCDLVTIGSRDGRDLGAPPDGSPPLHNCGDKVCAADQVCEFGLCRKDCGTNARCGDPEMCCSTGDVCSLGSCVTPGQDCGNGTGENGVCVFSRACPMGEYCEVSIAKCLPLQTTAACEYQPPVGQFSPKVKWEWMGSAANLPNYNQVMMTPVVADLDGDCMPDIVFSSFKNVDGAYFSDGVVRALRGDGSGELWSATDPALRSRPSAQIALADIDQDGKIEIFTCHESGKVMALNFDGTLKWFSAQAICGTLSESVSVADVNHDGAPEVIVGFTVLSAATGAVLNTPPSVARPVTVGNTQYGYYTTVAEIDGDLSNGMEIVGGGIVYHWNGTLLWDQSGGNTGYAAVGDLDGDGQPEVVSVVPGTNSVYAYTKTGQLLWGPENVNQSVATPSGPVGGGPPTIADFNGDGKPDVATAGGYGYLVLSGPTGAVLWQSTVTIDASSRSTGSSVFDFDGDGIAEVLYNDEHNLRVFSGPTGDVKIKMCNTSATLWEYPVIVDVDGDDHAEIVVANNNFFHGTASYPPIDTCDTDLGGGPSHNGIKVIGDVHNNWVRTRRIWNQHDYHVTNINDNGTVPTNEAPNWTMAGLNDFRQNVQINGVLAAPDLVAADLHLDYGLCGNGTLTLVASVVNQGQVGAPAGVPVTFYYQNAQGAQVAIFTVKTTAVILAGAYEVVAFKWTPSSDLKGPFSITVVVDDAGTPNSGIVNECNEDNNALGPTTLGCDIVN